MTPAAPRYGTHIGSVRGSGRIPGGRPLASDRATGGDGRPRYFLLQPMLLLYASSLSLMPIAVVRCVGFSVYFPLGPL